MKLNAAELQAEWQYRMEQIISTMYPSSIPTKEQLEEIKMLIEPEMEASRKFEYEE